MATENEQAVLNEAFAYYSTPPNHFRECKIMEQLAAIIERRDKQIAELVEFIEDLKYRHNMMSQHQLNKLVEAKIAKHKGA